MLSGHTITICAVLCCAATKAQYFAEIVGVMPSRLANGSAKMISGIIEGESTNFQPIAYLYDGERPET